MPSIRVLSVLEMQQNTFFKAHQKLSRSSGKSAAAKDLQKSSKRARCTREPSTPVNEPIQKGARIVASLPGNLIHLSQSADGKLRWLPPSSSSSSSLNECTTFSGCFSAADCGPLVNVDSALILSSRKHGKEKSSDDVGSSSPSLTFYCQNHVSDSSIIHSSETVNSSDVQEASIGSHHMAPSSSELSFSSQQQAAPEGSKKMMASRSCGLSPYLSSKLKPGKHILGVKRQQLFIRPGQLRHWAVGNSPSLATNLANLPTTSLKGKACRNLAF